MLALGLVACGAGASDESSATGAPVDPCKQSSASSKVIQIALTDDHACAVREDGTLVCWGNNDEGEVLPGSYPVLAPVRVDIDCVAEVVAGTRFTAVRKKNGEVHAWGSEVAATPGAVGTFLADASPATAIFGRGESMAALQRDGRFLLWGVGVDADHRTFAPFEKPGVNPFRAVSWA